jgi:hypothetical protein
MLPEKDLFMKDYPFIYSTDAAIIATFLGVLIIAAIYFGYKLAVWKKKKNSFVADDGSSGISGALFGVLGLILAFTFSMSGNRFDDRRKVITEEANDIGTAILRCDLYPDDVRAKLRSAFKGYLEARIDYLEAGIDLDRVATAMAAKERYADTIWHIATKFAHDNPSYFVPSSQMIPALNDMIDVTTKRLALDLARVPDAIVVLLFLLSILCGFFGGYSVGQKAKLDWVVVVGFTLIITTVIYTTLDLERTRRGLTTLNENNRFIIQLREMLKQ